MSTNEQNQVVIYDRESTLAQIQESVTAVKLTKTEAIPAAALDEVTTKLG